MNTVYFDISFSDDKRRQKLYDGDLFVYSPSDGASAFCRFTREMLRETFRPFDPQVAQRHLPLADFVDILTDLKPRFIGHEQSKRYIQKILREQGCDLNKTYFDVPRLRTSTSDGYLTSGIAYAFHPHRDTWYSAPLNQVNWWLPVYEIEPDNCMAFHLEYWDKSVQNTSSEFSYREWNLNGRKSAHKQVKTDRRRQPHALETLHSADTKIICKPGGVVIFSGAQMHSSVTNTSGKTRFSIDFRTVHLDDVEDGRGAPNKDSACQDTTLGDFLRASDLSPFPAGLIARHSSVGQIQNDLVQ